MKAEGFSRSGSSPPASRSVSARASCSSVKARTKGVETHAIPDATITPIPHCIASEGDKNVTSEYLTSQEAANLLKINIKTLQRWSLTSSMPVLRHGGTVRYHRDRLLAWLQAQESRSQGQRKGSKAAAKLLTT